MSRNARSGMLQALAGCQSTWVVTASGGRDDDRQRLGAERLDGEPAHLERLPEREADIEGAVADGTGDLGVRRRTKHQAHPWEAGAETSEHAGQPIGHDRLRCTDREGAG